MVILDAKLLPRRKFGHPANVGARHMSRVKVVKLVVSVHGERKEFVGEVKSDASSKTKGRHGIRRHEVFYSRRWASIGPEENAALEAVQAVLKGAINRLRAPIPIRDTLGFYGDVRTSSVGRRQIGGPKPPPRLVGDYARLTPQRQRALLERETSGIARACRVNASEVSAWRRSIGGYLDMLSKEEHREPFNEYEKTLILRGIVGFTKRIAARNEKQSRAWAP